MNSTQTFELSMEVTVVCTRKQTDYGARGSPVWYEADDIDIETVTMFGRDWSPADLVAAFGAMGATSLTNLIIAEIDDDNWEWNE